MYDVDNSLTKRKIVIYVVHKLHDNNMTIVACLRWLYHHIMSYALNLSRIYHFCSKEHYAILLLLSKNNKYLYLYF